MRRAGKRRSRELPLGFRINFSGLRLTSITGPDLRRPWTWGYERLYYYEAPKARARRL